VIEVPVSPTYRSAEKATTELVEEKTRSNGFAIALFMVLAAQRSAQSSVTGGVTLKEAAGGLFVTTAADKLRLDVCGPTVAHVVVSPDGSAADATPQQQWLVATCKPAKYTLTMPGPAPEMTEEQRLWNPREAVVDTGGLKV